MVGAAVEGGRGRQPRSFPRREAAEAAVSAPLELRLALLEERCYPLAQVLGPHRVRDSVALELEAFASAQRKESDALSGFDDAATAPAATPATA